MVDSIVEQAKCAGQSPGKWSDEVDRLGGRRKADNGQAGIRSHVAGDRIASQRTEHGTVAAPHGSQCRVYTLVRASASGGMAFGPEETIRPLSAAPPGTFGTLCRKQIGPQNVKAA